MVSYMSGGRCIQARSLKIRLGDLLKAKYPNLKYTAVAEALGISDTTLRKYLRNEALTLERRVLETACDYLGVEINELLELVPSNFFPDANQPLKLLRGE